MELFLDLRRQPEGGTEVEPLLGCYQMFLGHELPNMLVPVQAFARMVLLQAEGLDEDSRRLLERIADLTRKVDAQVRRIAEIGRLDREPAFGPPVVVEEVVREVIAEVSCSPGPVSARLETTVPPRVPRLPLSRSLLHRVLVELVRNAVHAVLTDRPLSVEVGLRLQPTTPPGWEYALWVRDNGRGFSEAQLAHLFEPFAAGRGQGGLPGGSGGSDQPPGAGVGLFLISRVVARWGGGLHVRSSTEGTTVTCLLPDFPSQPGTVGTTL